MAAADIVIREAVPDELVADSPLFSALSTLLADCMYVPTSEEEQKIYARTLRANLVSVFAGASRRDPTAVGRSTVLVAEEVAEQRRLIGVCGMQMLALTPDGRGEEAMSSLTRDRRAAMSLRPLLSNLAVSTDYRRRGIATRLVARSEAVAVQWNFDELLLLVSDDNTAARRLYRRRGYVDVGEPLDGEECAIAPWYLGGGLAWRPCQNVCMRRTGLEAHGTLAPADVEGGTCAGPVEAERRALEEEAAEGAAVAGAEKPFVLDRALVNQRLREQGEELCDEHEWLEFRRFWSWDYENVPLEMKRQLQDADTLRAFYDDLTSIWFLEQWRNSDEYGR